MALEDRCSPQSAPSPTGIPHSPQSTSSSSLILDMSIHSPQSQNSVHHYNNSNEKQQQNSTVSTELTTFDQQMSLQVRNYDHHLSSPQSLDGGVTATIKEEESDSMDYEDHEQSNTISEDHHRVNHQPPAPPQLPVISFSITNILSDRFGKIKLQQKQQQQHHQSQLEQQQQQQQFHQQQQQFHQQQCITTEKKPIGAIFRPFETTTKSSNNDQCHYNNTERSAFTRLTGSAAEAIDYSRSTVPNNSAAAAAAAMIVDRANFLNCFNPVAYPRIHEEILNSTRKYKQYAQIPVAEVKIPPLGSLCKTVSQIGQPHHHPQSSPSTAAGMCLSSPPPSASSSMSSASSTSASPSCRLPMSPQPIPPQSVSRDSGMESSDDTRSETGSTKDDNGPNPWPAWVYCTRYSDRPSSGPRYRRPKQPKDKAQQSEEKRPRTAFSSEQLARLKREFNENRYLTERRRQQLSSELGLNEAQIKIWFQNKRAKIKKSSGTKNPLALQLMAQGLYNHTTVPLTKEEEELEMRMNGHL